MTLHDLKRRVEKYIADDQLDSAFQLLLERVVEKRGTVLSFSSNWSNLKNKLKSGAIRDSEKDFRRNNIIFGLTQLLEDLEQNDIRFTDSSKLCHDRHKFTCDRIEQDDVFQDKKYSCFREKLNFFYLYGQFLEAHYSLMERFSYDQRGILETHLGEELKPYCKVMLTKPLVIVPRRNLESSKREVVKKIFSSFNLNPNEHGPLGEKSITYLWQHSPTLSDYGSKDFVFVYLGIPEYHWEPDLTPSLVVWFMNEFCGPQLPEEAPSFFFFLGVEFEEELSESRKEILEAIHQYGDKIHILPELTMVKELDVKSWFREYQTYFDIVNIEKLVEKVMEGKKEEHMKPVEEKLKEAIDEFFEKRLS